MAGPEEVAEMCEHCPADVLGGPGQLDLFHHGAGITQGRGHAARIGLNIGGDGIVPQPDAESDAHAGHCRAGVSTRRAGQRRTPGEGGVVARMTARHDVRQQGGVRHGPCHRSVAAVVVRGERGQAGNPSVGCLVADGPGERRRQAG